MHGLLILASLAHAQDCVPFDLDARSEAAIAAFTDAEFEQASDLARSGIANLECLERVADPEDLAVLWQVLGAAAYYQDAPEVAARNMALAAAVYPGHFEERLGAEVKAVWVEAGQTLGAMGTIAADPIPDDGVFYVDGQPEPEQPAARHPGTHLVQVSVGAEVAYARVVELTDGPVLELNTGLPEPTELARPKRRLLWAGVGAGAAGLGTLGAALVLDQRLATNEAEDDLGKLENTRAAEMVLAKRVAPALGVVALTGVTLHFVFE